MVDYCEVDNETSISVEVVEFFDGGFAASGGFCSSELDAINKLILLSEF